MATRWEQGRAVVDVLLREGRLDRVTPSTEQADSLIRQATMHLASAATLTESDPTLAFSAAYDAARKALTAILAVQGLRPTAAGGHIAVGDAVRAQLDPPLGAKIKPFGWMRRTRNASEYPSLDVPLPDADEVREAITLARDIVGMAETVVPKLPVYGA